MRKRTIGVLIIIFLVIAGMAGAYLAIGMRYRTHFFENTSINGIDVSDKTAEEAEALIADQAEDYSVTVTTREGNQETIDGEEIGYRFVSGGEVQGFLDAQNFLAWLPALLGQERSYTMEASTAYDEEKLTQAVEALDCMQEENMTAPRDASVQQQEDGSFAVTAEVKGNWLDTEKAVALVKETVDKGGRAANFDLSGCYAEPQVLSDDEGLKKEAELRNKYSSITITYDMGGDVTVTLDPETIYSWFSITEDGEAAIDRDAVATWVNQLADQYDTVGSFLPFVTSNGETVYPESVTYGWQMDRESETEQLYQQLLTGESAQRSPVWLEGAWTRGENDIGDTYVEIDYTNQRMWYYKDGALLVETSVVTGNVSAGNASPEGVFCLVGKEEDATLVGEDYKTPVDYWMPFYGGVGIHDADTWRSTYGGDIYMYSGSHGCINTPTAQAAIIFENIEVGTPIVCYSSGTNYGYGQQSGGGASGSAGSGDIQIMDGTADSSAGTTDGASDGSADAGTDSGENAGSSAGESSGDISITDERGSDTSGSSDGNGGLETGEADFPITTTDEWSGDSQGQIIY